MFAVFGDKPAFNPQDPNYLEERPVILEGHPTEGTLGIAFDVLRDE
jgi:hypothetical protein